MRRCSARIALCASFGLIGEWTPSHEHSARASTATPMLRTVRFDAELHTEFDSRGGAVRLHGGRVRYAAGSAMERERLLSLRLAPEKHPFTGDTVLKVTLLGLQSAVAAPGISILGRLAGMIWFVALAGLPSPAVTYILRRARAQSRRSLLARVLVQLSNRP